MDGIQIFDVCDDERTLFLIQGGHQNRNSVMASPDFKGGLSWALLREKKTTEKTRFWLKLG